MEVSSLMTGIAACLGGIALGLAYFAALRGSIDAFTKEQSWRRALLLTIFRLFCAAAAFFLFAQAGAVALVASFAGFLIARTLVLSRFRESL